MTKLQSSRNPFPFLQRYLPALAAALLVLGGHFWMIDHAGSPVPVHDQWLAEGEMLYVPLIEDRLTTAAIVHPHAEHRIIPTRLLALALFKLNHHVWDVRLQMTVNSFLAGALAAFVVLIASRQLGRLALILFAAAFGALFASPLFYGNTLWGFQSQFYFLLLFSVLHLDLVLRQPVLSLGWGIGVACSLLASLSMGSGFFSAAIILAMSTWTLVRVRLRDERRAALFNLVIHAAIVGTAWIWSAPVSAVAFDASSALHTLVHCLSWPQRFYNPWGAWVWLPFVLFLGSLLPRTTLSRNDRVVLALGLWVLAQIAAISLTRNAPTPVITPRYYEIFWIGLVANTLALQRLVQMASDRGLSRGFRLASHVFVAAWIAPVTYYATTFAQSHGRHDLAAYQTFAQSQTQQVKAFLASGELQVLQALPYPKVPHPDPRYLARLLRNPTLRAVLPPELTDFSPPPLSRWAAGTRGTAGLLALLAAGLLLRELWSWQRSRPDGRAGTAE